MPLPSVEESTARGRAARAEAPRSAHGTLAPHPGRPDPVALIERQAETRVPELVPIRHGRMLASPFAFFRGAALIMAADLATMPHSGLRVQLCGDAHLSNFGVFASPERRLVFDLNDFDETLPGPWEWDVKRLAASLAVAGRDNGFGTADRAQIVVTAMRSYREAMRAFAVMGTLDVWYAHLEVEPLLDQIGSEIGPKDRRRVERDLARARTRDNLHSYSKLTHLVDGEPRIAADPPLVVPAEEIVPGATAVAMAAVVRGFMRGYQRSLETDRRALLDQFRFVHLAHKVVGVGSVGTQTWIALLVGRGNEDPLLLQIKQAQASVLEEFAGASAYANHGQRVVAGQRLMQATSDIFLGWRRMTGPDGKSVDFYARQLKDWKGSVTVEDMAPRHMAAYGRMCGWTLARAHARSGDRVAIAAYLGGGDSFDRALAVFAEAYAERNERDHAEFAAAVESGRVAALPGV
ncbi:MAG TPA: DUF2252 domain-containing protein [Gaiellales bacterium]